MSAKISKKFTKTPQKPINPSKTPRFVLERLLLFIQKSRFKKDKNACYKVF